MMFSLNYLEIECIYRLAVEMEKLLVDERKHYDFLYVPKNYWTLVRKKTEALL